MRRICPMSNVTSGRRIFQEYIANFETRESVKMDYIFG